MTEKRRSSCLRLSLTIRILKWSVWSITEFSVIDQSSVMSFEIYGYGGQRRGWRHELLLLLPLTKRILTRAYRWRLKKKSRYELWWSHTYSYCHWPSEFCAIRLMWHLDNSTCHWLNEFLKNMLDHRQRRVRKLEAWGRHKFPKIWGFRYILSTTKRRILRLLQSV